VAVDVRLEESGVPSGTVPFITDEGQMHQESLGASGTGTVVWRTTASLAAYARAEVRHPKAERHPRQGQHHGSGPAVGPDGGAHQPDRPAVRD
jgi:hypothetical protein